jgi:signal transduction histidine kinase
VVRAGRPIEVDLSALVSEALASAQADPHRVAQVLRNLLLNALRHTPSGGSVSVSAASATEVVEIAVADTGEGIAAEDLPHVFERFWRAEPARARSKAGGEERVADGTGPELAVAQSLVAAQGGRIWAESTPGEGAIFRFTLPCRRAEPQQDLPSFAEVGSVVVAQGAAYYLNGLSHQGHESGI